MHSYVTPADDAPLGVRKRGLSKGKAGSVREQVESWKVRGKIGRVGNLAKSRVVMGMDGSGGFLCAWREVRAKGLAHREAERRGGGGEGENPWFWSLVLGIISNKTPLRDGQRPT